MPELAKAQDVRERRNTRVASIFKNFRLLKQILWRHEATIQKRWMKKTKEQKRKIILAAWGGPMPTSHRPDFAAYRKMKAAGDGAKDRADLMWPFVNQEDLTKPKVCLVVHWRTHKLLILLQPRHYFFFSTRVAEMTPVTLPQQSMSPCTLESSPSASFLFSSTFIPCCSTVRGQKPNTPNCFTGMITQTLLNGVFQEDTCSLARDCSYWSPKTGQWISWSSAPRTFFTISPRN